MVTLERFRWWHVAQVLPIEAALFGDEPWTERTFWSELGQVATRRYLVALEDGVPVGYAGLCDHPDEAWVQTMAVAPDRQGRGLGTRLLVALLEQADRLGQRRVALEVRADNIGGQKYAVLSAGDCDTDQFHFIPLLMHCSGTS